MEAAINADVERGIYDGRVIVIARASEIGLRKALGFAERARQRPVQIDDVFSRLTGVASQY